MFIATILATAAVFGPWREWEAPLARWRWIAHRNQELRQQGLTSRQHPCTVISMNTTATRNPLYIGARGSLIEELQAIASDELGEILTSERITEAQHAKLVAYLASEVAGFGMLSNEKLTDDGLDNAERRAIRTPALAIVRRFA